MIKMIMGKGPNDSSAQRHEDSDTDMATQSSPSPEKNRATARGSKMNLPMKSQSDSEIASRRITDHDDLSYAPRLAKSILPAASTCEKFRRYGGTC